MQSHIHTRIIRPSHATAPQLAGAEEMVANEASEELREMAKEERGALRRQVGGRRRLSWAGRRDQIIAMHAVRRQSWRVSCLLQTKVEITTAIRSLPPTPTTCQPPQIEELRESLVAHLLPPDEDDERNTVLEVRGHTYAPCVCAHYMPRRSAPHQAASKPTSQFLAPTPTPTSPPPSPTSPPPHPPPSTHQPTLTGSQRRRRRLGGRLCRRPTGDVPRLRGRAGVAV
jgi:hypothetical protein